MKLLVCLLLALLLPLTVHSETLTIVGSGTVATAIKSSIAEFQKANGAQVELRPTPSLRGIFSVAEGKADIGLTITPVTEAQRQLYPSVDFQNTVVGRGAIYLLVSPDVWDAGVRALSKEQVLSVVEKKSTTWKDLGGADFPVTFFSPGGGSKMAFTTWLYGKTNPAIEAKLNAMMANGTLQAENLASTRGALGAFSEWARPGESKVHKIAVTTPDGPIEPTAENISSGRYPISFDLFLITNGPARGAAKAFVDFLLTDKAQALIEAEGYARPQKTSK